MCPATQCARWHSTLQNRGRSLRATLSCRQPAQYANALAERGREVHEAVRREQVAPGQQSFFGKTRFHNANMLRTRPDERGQGMDAFTHFTSYMCCIKK